MRHLVLERIFFFLNTFLSALSAGLVMVLAVYLSAVGLTGQEVVMLMAMIGLGGLFSVVCSGMLLRQTSVGVTLVSANAAMLLASCSLSVLGLAAVVPSVFLSGFGIAAARVSLTYVASQAVTSAERQELLAWRRFLLNIGVALGALIGSTMVGYSPILFLILWVVIASTALVASILYLTRPEIRIRIQRASRDDISQLLSPNLALYVLGFSLATIPFALLQSAYAVSLLSTPGFDGQTVGAVFALNGVLIAILQIPLLRLIGRLKESHKIIGSAILICAGITTIGFAPSFPVLVFTVVVWTVGEVVFFISSLSHLVDRSIGGRLAVILIYQSSLSLIELVAPLVFGGLFPPDANFFWVVIACVAASGICFLAVSLRYTEKTTPTKRPDPPQN